MTSRFIVYSREGCHLCEDLVEHLEQLAREYRFEYEVRDVDDKAEWLAAYDTRVPVVEFGGDPVCEYFLDQAALLACLETGRAGR